MIAPGCTVRHGRYRYSVRRVEMDGSVTCWGPINNDPNGRRGWRTFRADDVHEVERMRQFDESRRSR